MQTYIINLPTRSDRRNHALHEVTKMPALSSTIMNGIIDNTGTCFQSHRNCVQKAKDLDLEYIVILEDDVVFEDNCIDIFSTAFREVQKLNWDMFYLGANLYSYAQKIGTNIVKLTGALCAHAYIVHNKFYDTILSLQHDKEMDTHYGELMLHHNIYMCNPMIAYQLPSHSDLQHGFRDYNCALRRNFLTYVR